RLGAWMPRIRDRIFLATKTGDRTAGAAYDSLRRSLDRLRTDRVDLIQLHAVGSLDELESVTGRGGALEGVIRAHDEGLAAGTGDRVGRISTPSGTPVRCSSAVPGASFLIGWSICFPRIGRTTVVRV